MRVHEPDYEADYEAQHKIAYWPVGGIVHKNEITCDAQANMYHADCEDHMMAMPQGQVKLVMTSPPYADMRKKQYGGIPHGQYVDWWMKRVSPGLDRVLREDGSVVINIKENTLEGELTTYVYELVLAMREAGWKWIDEYVWLKTAPSPGKWPNRLKCAWERCLHFAKTTKIKLYHDQMLEENTETFDRWLESKMAKQAIETGYTTGSPHTDHSRNYGRFAKLEKTLPANVVVAPNASSSKTSSMHAAPFNPRVPGFFIALMTEEGDIVLDPFAGTGTTCWQALHTGRNAVGIEMEKTYYNLYPKLVRDYGWSWQEIT